LALRLKQFREPRCPDELEEVGSLKANLPATRHASDSIQVCGAPSVAASHAQSLKELKEASNHHLASVIVVNEPHFILIGLPKGEAH
jgi:hypothetical protein